MVVPVGRGTIYFSKIADADITTPNFALRNLAAVKFNVMVGGVTLATSVFALVNTASLLF
jgi:hypothetical protein